MIFKYHQVQLITLYPPLNSMTSPQNPNFTVSKLILMISAPFYPVFGSTKNKSWWKILLCGRVGGGLLPFYKPTAGFFNCYKYNNFMSNLTKSFDSVSDTGTVLALGKAKNNSFWQSYIKLTRTRAKVIIFHTKMKLSTTLVCSVALFTTSANAQNRPGSSVEEVSSFYKLFKKCLILQNLMLKF